jgi:signal transduction histidine kinase
VLSSSRNMQGRPALPYRPGEGTDPKIRTVDGVPIEDDDFRVLTQRLRLPDGDFGILHVAVEFEVDESAESLTKTLAVVFPTVLAVLAALIWAVVGRALRPVEAIRTEVASISAAALDRRVPAPPGNDEIARLAGTMNAMLERVEESHRRQQRFVADAAHELRSPLTSIRSELEVDLANPAGADHEATHRSVLEEAERLSRLVDSLLFLAKADAGEGLRVMSNVDLDEIVLRESRALRLRGAMAVDTSAVSGAQLRGDADQLTRAVRNLLDNAGRHARSTVTVSLSEGDGGVTLVVADDGPGVPAGLADRVFERFVRVDDARSRDHGGAGLGLAITREIVQRHGGTIALDGGGPGARFVTRFPSL